MSGPAANWYFEVETWEPGKESRIAAKARTIDGGFHLDIYQRDGEADRLVLRIVGEPIGEDEPELVLTIEDRANDKEATVLTKGRRPGQPKRQPYVPPGGQPRG